MFRTATIEDLEQLIVLYEELHRYHIKINPERFKMPDDNIFESWLKYFLTESRYDVIIHEDNGKPDAYAVLSTSEYNYSEEYPRKTCTVEHFLVTEQVHGQGTGTALFNEIREYALERNCDYIRLNVDAKNPMAIKFYEKMGLAPRSINMEMKI